MEHAAMEQREHMESEGSQTSSSSSTSSFEHGEGSTNIPENNTLMSEDSVSVSSTNSASYHFHQSVKITTADPHPDNTGRVPKIHSNVCSGNQFSDNYIKVQKGSKQL